MKSHFSKPTIVFDFDGVIHSYKSGWQGDSVIADPPTDGINFAIYNLQKDFEIVIVSSRCRSEEGRNAIIKWCNQHGIYFDKVMAEKPPAVCYIDDRAICFDGNSASLPDKVRNFKSWCELMNKLNFGFSKTIDQQSISIEEILKASSEGRLLVLPYSVGQTVYRPEYPTGSNRMIPTPVFLNSALQVVAVMFDDTHQYFETSEECEHYLKEFYEE